MTQPPPESNKPFWMRRGVWAFAMFAVVCVAAPAFHDMNSPTIVAGILLASIAAVCAGMGFWLGFGESILRLAVIPVGLCLVVFNMTIAFRDNDPLLYGVFALMTTAMVGAPIFVVRIVRRGRLLLSSSDSDIGSLETLRFSIWHILVFMTAIGVLSAIGKAFFASGIGSSPGPVLTTAGLGATLGICSVVVVWATLGKETGLRSFVSCLVALGLAFVNVYLFGGGRESWIWVLITMLVWLQMMILMWLARSEGYRFVTQNE